MTEESKQKMLDFIFNLTEVERDDLAERDLMKSNSFTFVSIGVHCYIFNNEGEKIGSISESDILDCIDLRKILFHQSDNHFCQNCS